MNSLSRYAAAAALCAALAASGAAPAKAQSHDTSAAHPARTAKATETAMALRDLWIGHAFWVRNVALETLQKNESAAKAAEEQVVANAKAIAAAFEPFYGAAAKDALFKLLAGHYGAAKGYLVATAAGDAAGQSKATEALTSNADGIATFLSKANPHLPKDAVNGLLLAHGGHHIAQIQELKAGDYAAEAKTWEDMKSHMYVVADALTDGLAMQFASKF